MAYTNLQVSYAQDMSELTLVHLVGTEGQQIKPSPRDSLNIISDETRQVYLDYSITNSVWDGLDFRKQQDTQIVLCSRSRREELEKEWAEDGDAVR